MSVALIDYGIGNLLSVRNALVAAGADVRVVRTGEGLIEADHIVLPGVGAFAATMQALDERGFADALTREVIGKVKPFLGICVGMQVLAEHGHETATCDGLGWLPGDVVPLRPPGDLAVPHVGWNNVRGRGTLFHGIPDDTSFYFLHGFALQARDPAWVCGTTEYGEPIVSAIEHENIMGVQFHPEKSHRFGRAVLANFLAFRA